VTSPALWGAAAGLAIAALFGPVPSQASDQSPFTSKSDSVLSQSVGDLTEGQIFSTNGLVCDKPSEVDAVVTLARKGEALKAALNQINAGAQVPRCVMGQTLIARYVARATTFSIDDQPFYIHEVIVVGVAVQTPRGVVPFRLKKPMKQYVVSTLKSVSA